MLAGEGEASLRQRPTSVAGANEIFALGLLLRVGEIDTDDFEVDLIFVLAPGETAGRDLVRSLGDVLGINGLPLAAEQVDGEGDDLVVSKLASHSACGRDPSREFSV